MGQASEDSNSCANSRQAGGGYSLTGDVRRYIDKRLAFLSRSMLEPSSGLRRPLMMMPSPGNRSPQSDRQGPADNSTILMRKQPSSDESQAATGGGENSNRDQESGLESSLESMLTEGYPKPTEDRRDRSPYDDFFNESHSFSGGLNHLFSSLFNSFFGSSPFPLGGFSTSLDSVAWPISYLFFSPYSPVHLERPEATSREGMGVLFPWLFHNLESEEAQSSNAGGQKIPNWRLAFEDLLRVENGLELRDVTPDAHVDRNETGAQWVSEMVNRGSFGPKWKLLQAKDKAKAKDDDDDDIKLSFDYDIFAPWWNMGQLSRLFDGFGVSDESDLYDFFNRSFFERNPFRRGAPDSLSKSDNYKLDNMIDEQDRTGDTDPSKPKVVATSVTTTRRTTLKDGTTTKTVKKQRFSDGHEETTETNETTEPKS